jgi:amino-acid N-acetyltransferase
MDFVSQFRNSAPYIHAYRGKTTVVWLRKQALSVERLKSTISDLALLNSLGLKLVILFEVDSVSAEQRIDESLMQQLTSSIGQFRYTIEGLFSQGISNSPMHGAKVRVVSGNFVMGRPAGVFHGQDLKFQGRVRRIDGAAISEQLDKQRLVLIPPLGYSVTGEILYLPPEQLVVAMARQIQADKVVIIGDNPLALTNNQKEIGVSALQSILSENDAQLAGYLELHVASSVAAAGIARCHVIDGATDGALLAELFTRDGVGTLIALDQYDTFRTANVNDLQGILSLLKPLEDQQILVKREPEQLASEIEHFVVNERDGMIIGCAAIYSLSDTQAELACVAVHPEYQKSGRGDALLHAIQKRANLEGIQQLIVLTTQTEHWFVERGFAPIDVSELPQTRQALYNKQRNSKVYSKKLT